MISTILTKKKRKKKKMYQRRRRKINPKNFVPVTVKTVKLGGGRIMEPVEAVHCTKSGVEQLKKVKSKRFRLFDAAWRL